MLLCEAPGAEGAVVAALRAEAEGEKAEAPLALHVHGLYHSPAVRASPRRRLPPNHPLVLVTDEHQTHLSIAYASIRLITN